MKVVRILYILFISVFIVIDGCAPSTPHSDPMTGWKKLRTFDSNANPETIIVPEAIRQDALAFFKTLSKVESVWAENDTSSIGFWEDDTGQHAAVLQCAHDNEFWHYALIYNRDNKRIRVIKYSTNSYMS